MKIYVKYRLKGSAKKNIRIFNKRNKLAFRKLKYHCRFNKISLNSKIKIPIVFDFYFTADGDD